MSGRGELELELNRLPERPVRRASVVLALRSSQGKSMVALDSRNDEFVRILEFPHEDTTALLAVSNDGSQVLLRTPYQGLSSKALCLHTLQTGSRRLFISQTGGQRAAAMSPDGKRIAVLLSTADRAIVDLIDIETEARRPVWEEPGGWSMESAIAWSPSGGLLAVTYLLPNEEIATLVIDTGSGAVLARYESSGILGSSNGSWFSDHELLLLPEYDDEDGEPYFEISDLHRRQTRRLKRSSGSPLALVDGGFIQMSSGPAAPEVIRVLSTEINNRGERPLFLVRTQAQLESFDIAPAVLRQSTALQDLGGNIPG